MGCGASVSKVSFERDGKVIPLTQRELLVLKKWGLGALCRRRFKKMVQLQIFKTLKKPMYVDGRLVHTDERLFTDGELSYYINSTAGGQGMYWNTFNLKQTDGTFY
jgi:hypothetical protein